MSKKKAKTVLHKQEGLDVTEIAMIITGTGDGLSKAMAIEPRQFRQGDKVYVVLETACEKIRFDRIHDKSEENGDVPDLRRVQILKAGVASIVDADLVDAMIEQQRTLNAEYDAAREEERRRARGEQTLVTETGEDPGTVHVGPDPKPISDTISEVVDLAKGRGRKK